jgi:uncharacterized protein YecE (DUF72 family)
VTAPALLAGASGFSFPTWRPGFYPAGTKQREFLRRYAEQLPTVELNTSFYRLPAAAQLERWAAEVPAGFRFAVKAPRRISIWGRVEEGPELCARVRVLGDRLGPLLVRLHDARTRDDGFLTALLDGLDPGLPIALDLRDPSWDGIEDALERPETVRVNQLESPASFRYLRLREPPYDDAALRAWAARIEPVLAGGVTVFAYFRHEDEPTAPAYAARLLELVGDRGVARERAAPTD